ncbi:MAG: hypothetical protein R3F39_03000 [Myxococcota bacterium]
MSSPARTPLALALAASLALIVAMGVATSACTPLALLQDARIMPKGEGAPGFGVAVSMPTRKGTYAKPDGDTQDDQTDLYLKPLAHVLGWYRRGVGGQVEFQGLFSLPTFTLGAAMKVGLIGPDEGSPFALSLSAEMGGSPVLGQALLAGGMNISVQVAEKVSLDTAGHFGVVPGLWRRPGLTATAGVSIKTDRRIWHVAGGYTFDIGFDSNPAAYLAVGFTE